MGIAGLAATVAAAVLCLSGCANLGYYWQSATGHLSLMTSSRPVEDWLADRTAPPALKARLAMSQRIRDFAVSELRLPDNPSYRRYADLQRRAAVWNVVAAPAYSLTLYQWCFPVTGCIGYRGYYTEEAARAEAAQLQARGLETSVYGVPAYSTLGWLNWAGGDPLLNTFIGYPEGELARLIFHELAHQVAYAKGDTMFNESFATAVERLGIERWLAARAGDPAGEKARAEYAAFDSRRNQFRALTLDIRRKLADVYEPKEAAGRSSTAKAAMKLIAMQEFRSRYEALKVSWGGFAGYDGWVAQANNAAFGAQAAYDELVPRFEALFAREGRDWNRFYDSVRRLAERPYDERREELMR